MGHLELQAVEPAAVHVTVRAILAARNYLAQDGTAIAFASRPLQIEVRGEQKTAICFPITACAAASGMESAQERQAAVPNPIQVAATSAPHPGGCWLRTPRRRQRNRAPRARGRACRGPRRRRGSDVRCGAGSSDRAALSGG